jgi:hypothetical protein
MSDKLPEVYYDANTGSWWLRVSKSRFIDVGLSELRLHLRKAGLFAGKSDDGLNDVEKLITTAQIERHVDYAGPLAGHRAGVFTMSSGRRCLITSEPNAAVFEKAEGPTGCPFIENFIDRLFGPEQMRYALLWLHFAVKSLRRGDFQPGQLIVCAGPPTCGKSFFHHLVTELLGGRMGKPYLYMSGKTTFNADLAEAESLVMEDDQASTDIRSRLAFKAAIKQMTVNETMHVHGKGLKGTALSTFKRLSLSCNCEAENLAILPPLDDDALGKIMLFLCRDARPVLSTDRKENREKLAKELPAFRAYLSGMKCPPKMRDDRFGVASYHNKELLEATNALAPETRLLALIDNVIFGNPEIHSIDRTSDEIEKELRASAFGFAVDKLLGYSSACGAYLGRLEKRTDRVKSRRVKGQTFWEITRP